MKQEIQHDRLAQLGEELLREFAAAETVSVPAEFHRKCREMIGRKKPFRQAVLWTARAAVLAFALLGVMTVAVLSVDTLRTPFIQLAVECFPPEQEEEMTEYRQISYIATDNVELGVYYDGEASYQLLWSNEYGQRLYNFQSPGMDEAFFHDLSAQLTAAEE